VVDDRSVLDEAYAAEEDRWSGRGVERPDHWGGYRVRPHLVEFWQGRPNRLHDRLRYRRDGDDWILERRSP
jgi:pyridoxamine 5'-phosphate oxidase